MISHINFFLDLESSDSEGLQYRTEYGCTLNALPMKAPDS